MRLYFLLQIRCSGPVCNCSKPELISSRSCWAPTSDWAPSLSDCEKCQKQNSPSVPVPMLAPHWTLQDLNSGFSPVPQLSMPPWKISPATPTSKDHRKEISTAKESSGPRAAQVDGTWGTIEASFFGLQLPATAGTCLWDVPSGHSSFYLLGHCIRCHLLVDKPGHEKVLSWALPGTAVEWPGSPGGGSEWIRIPKWMQNTDKTHGNSSGPDLQ